MTTNLPTPVPPHERHDGWTAARQRRFLDTLAATGSVAAAVRSAGMSRQSAYALRRQPAGAHFAAEWDAALADAGRLIEDLALERLVEGEVEEIERDGVVVAVRRRQADARLLLFLLKRLDSRRTAAARAAAPDFVRVDGTAVARLRAELRALMPGVSNDGPQEEPDPFLPHLDLPDGRA